MEMSHQRGGSLPRVPLAVSVLAILTLAVGCADEDRASIDGGLEGFAETKLTISFEVETTTMFEAVGETDPMIDRLVARPMSKREKVSIEVSQDDRVRLETRVLEASLPPPSISSALPTQFPRSSAPSGSMV